MGRTLARRVCLGVLAACAGLGALLLVSLVPGDATLMEMDFGQEYLLARAILDGVDPYQPVQVLGTRYVGSTGYFDKPYPTPHPPTVGLLALPLGWLSYPSAVRVWFGVELVSLLIAVGLLVRGAGLPIRLRNAPLMALALVAWPPVTLELGLGQLMLPLLLGLAGAQLALLGGRAALGGALWGLTLLVKPIAWPWLIVLAWRRDWRSLAAAALVVLTGGVLSLLAIGVGPTTTYLTRVLPVMAGAFFTEPTNISLWTVAPRLGNATLSAVLPAAIVLVALVWARRRAPLGASLAMMTIVSLLVSPIVWHFYLVLALLPLAQIVAELWRHGLRRAEVAAGLGLLVLMSVSQSGLIAFGHGGPGMGIVLVPVLALALLGVLLARLTHRAYLVDGDRARGAD